MGIRRASSLRCSRVNGTRGSASLGLFGCRRTLILGLSAAPTNRRGGHFLRLRGALIRSLRNRGQSAISSLFFQIYDCRFPRAWPAIRHAVERSTGCFCCTRAARRSTQDQGSASMSPELARLASGPARDDRPNGSIATLSVLCDEGASAVLIRAKQVPELVLWQAKPATMGSDSFFQRRSSTAV